MPELGRRGGAPRPLYSGNDVEAAAGPADTQKARDLDAFFQQVRC